MNKNFIVVAAGLGLVQLMMPGAKALAQKQLKAQDSTTALSDVVITASRSPKKQSEIGRVVTVISPEQIKQSQGRTLPELLNTVPGIVFSGANNAPGQSSSVFLRGASAGYTLILIDGFPVNDAQSIAGNYDLNSIAIDQIDHIEILKGSGSTLYGSDAVAGVINIITKHSQAQGIKTAVQFNGGSYNTFREAADVNGKINHTGIAINLSNTDSRGFSAAAMKPGTTGPAFDNDGFHQRSVSANINQDVTGNFKLRANLQLSRNSGDNDYDAYTDDIDYTYKRTFFNAGLGADWQLTSHNKLVVNASQNNVWSDFTNLPGDNYGSSSASQNLGRVSNFEGIFTYKLADWVDATSGASFKYYNSIQHSSYAGSGYSGASDLYGSTNIGSAYTSFFVKAGIFHAELGGRFNHSNKYGENFTYTINPSVLLFDRLKVFATAASAFKTPSLYQLYSQYGNIDLKPEQTKTSFEAGFDLEITKELSFNTAFYQRKINNVIYFYTDPKTFASYYRNGYQQNDRGFETELTYKKDGLTASAYWAVVDGKQIDDKGAETHNLYRRPKNSLGANVSYQILSTLTAGLNYKFTGTRADQDFSTYPATTVALKKYHLVDLHLQWQAQKKLSVFADLKNVLNQKYTDWVGYNTRGINFVAGARYQIN